MNENAMSSSTKTRWIIAVISFLLVAVISVAVIVALALFVFHLHKGSLRNKAYILNTPVNIWESRRETFHLFPIVYDGNILSGPSLNEYPDSIGVQDGVLIWKSRSPANRSKAFGMFDGKTGAATYAASEDELIELARMILGVDISGAFPLRDPQIFANLQGKGHLVMPLRRTFWSASVWEYERSFKEVLELARVNGATTASGKVSDPRGRPIQCEILEEGALIRIWSEMEDGTQTISVEAYIYKDGATSGKWKSLSPR